MIIIIMINNKTAEFFSKIDFSDHYRNERFIARSGNKFTELPGRETNTWEMLFCQMAKEKKKILTSKDSMKRHMPVVNFWSKLISLSFFSEYY